jgi:DNA-binding NarL/FixJ family response regulator
MTVVLVANLLDRSKLTAIECPVFVASLEALLVELARRDDVGAVLIDLEVPGALEGIGRVRQAYAGRIVAYGPHVATAALAAARAAGADEVLPRSRLFRRGGSS